MNDAHVYEMQVQMWKPNTWGVTRCLKVPTEEVKLEEIGLDKNLSNKEHPIAILDFLKRKTRTKTIKMVNVQCSRHSTEETTCEVEDKMRIEYPHLFELRY